MLGCRIVATDDDWRPARPTEYELEQLSPWYFCDAPGERFLYAEDYATSDGRNIFYDEHEDCFYTSADRRVEFVNQEPGLRGKPVNNTIREWLDDYGGIDNVLDAVGDVRVALRWDKDEPFYRWSTYGDQFAMNGSWMLDFYSPDDDCWLLYVNSSGKEGKP